MTDHEVVDRDAYLGIVLAGWVMAFTLPIGGIVAGALLAQRRPDHAGGMLTVAIVMLVAVIILAATL